MRDDTKKSKKFELNVKGKDAKYTCKETGKKIQNAANKKENRKTQETADNVDSLFECDGSSEGKQSNKMVRYGLAKFECYFLFTYFNFYLYAVCCYDFELSFTETQRRG